MKYLCVALFFVMILSIAGQVAAVDVPLAWSKASRAESYTIERSDDMGVTWVGAQDAGDGGPHVLDGAYTYTGTPEDKLVLFRVSSVAGAQVAPRLWSGAWYDHRLSPLPTPGGMGIP